MISYNHEEPADRLHEGVASEVDPYIDLEYEWRAIKEKCTQFLF
jgi:hypothetical protein